MAAYVIADIDITDPVGYEEYRNLAGPSIVSSGGKFLVRGGSVETLEGEWSPKRVTVLEFESVEQAKQWYESQEYGAAKRVRQKTAITNAFILVGV